MRSQVQWFDWGPVEADRFVRFGQAAFDETSSRTIEEDVGLPDMGIPDWQPARGGKRDR